nr:uracil-DNA glycosylase [Weissella diestrammenae]
MPLWQRLGSEYWAEVAHFLNTAYRDQQSVYPPKEQVFSALLQTPLAQTKVVILGQDPYPNVGQAMGLSFSVPKNTPIPKSLVNIYRELSDDLGDESVRQGDLSAWAQQGVLLLNTVLTVPAHIRNGHANLIWEPLTDAIIELVAQQSQPVAFFLWGRPAQAKERLITGPNNLVLKAAHPSPLAAYRGFFGSRPFSKANAFLERHGEAGIQW